MYTCSDLCHALSHHTKPRHHGRYRDQLGLHRPGKGVDALYTAREFIALTIMGGVEDLTWKPRRRLARHMLSANDVRGPLLVHASVTIGDAPGDLVRSASTYEEAVEVVQRPEVTGAVHVVNVLQIPKTAAGCALVSHALRDVVTV